MNIDSKEGIEAQRGGGAYTYVLAALVSAAYSAPYGGGCRLSETAGEDGCVDHWKADFFRTRADRATLLLRVALATFRRKIEGETRVGFWADRG